MVGHLRAEKDPLTLHARRRRLARSADIRFAHIGAALDAELGRARRADATRHAPAYRWLGGLPHAHARR